MIFRHVSYAMKLKMISFVNTWLHSRPGSKYKEKPRNNMKKRSVNQKLVLKKQLKMRMKRLMYLQPKNLPEKP